MYCMQNRRARNGLLRLLKADPPDPYSPSSPAYAERHRETFTALPGGMVRVDLGEPVHEKPRQPVTGSKAVTVHPAPPALSVGLSGAVQTLSEVHLPIQMVGDVPAKRSRTSHRAITRNA